MQMSSSSANAGAGAAGSVAPSDPNTVNQNWPGCFRHVARCRRLNKEEVVLILSDPLKFGLVRTEVLPPEGIESGTVYLCSKVRVVPTNVWQMWSQKNNEGLVILSHHVI